MPRKVGSAMVVFCRKQKRAKPTKDISLASVSSAHTGTVENGIRQRASVGLVAGLLWIVFYKEAKEIFSRLLLCDNRAEEARGARCLSKGFLQGPQEPQSQGAAG